MLNMRITKTDFILGHQPIPNYDILQELDRIQLLHFTERPIWQMLEAYNLGRIHGIQQERASKKAKKGHKERNV